MHDDRGQERRRNDLHRRPRNGQLPHGNQVARREMQTDAEHEENDADLGQLTGERYVGHIPRREWPDHDSGEQITHQRR